MQVLPNIRHGDGWSVRPEQEGEGTVIFMEGDFYRLDSALLIRCLRELLQEAGFTSGEVHLDCRNMTGMNLGLVTTLLTWSHGKIKGLPLVSRLTLLNVDDHWRQAFSFDAAMHGKSFQVEFRTP